MIIKLREAIVYILWYGSFVKKVYIDSDNNKIPILGNAENYFDNREPILTPEIKNKKILNLISTENEWKILKNYTLLKTFYKNTTTSSYLARSKTNNKTVVIKETRPNFWIYNNKDYQNFREKESDSLIFLNKLNIGPKFIEFFYDNNNLYLIYEYIEGINFHDFLSTENNFLKNRQTFFCKLKFVKKIILIFKELIKIFLKLEKNNFLYGDINSKNIIINSKNKPFLIDFELVSNFLNLNKNIPIGTLGFFQKI